MNLPNKITLSRLLLLPLIVFFYLADFIPYARLVAACLFMIACLTDLVDGKIARKYNMVTTLGKFFDTIADKCLIMTGLILILVSGIKGNSAVVTPTWAGVVCVIVILAREFMVSALRQLAAAKGVVLAADKGGKIKATVQFIVVTLYMFLAFYLTDLDKLITNRGLAEQISGSARFILIIALIGTALITVYTGASYVIKNRFVFTEAGDYRKEKKEPVQLADDEVVEEVEESDDKE